MCVYIYLNHYFNATSFYGHQQTMSQHVLDTAKNEVWRSTRSTHYVTYKKSFCSYSTT